MKKLVISFATAGLLLSAGAAFSQTPSPTVQKDAPAQSQAAPTTAPAANQGTTSTQRSGASAQTGERREGARRAEGGESRGDRSERREGGARTGINIRVGGGDRDGYRHRRGRLGYAEVGGHCRTVIVKSFRHGHRVIQRIRRCR